MVAKQLQPLGNLECVHQIRLANLIHSIVAIDEIQERGGLHGNQVYPFAFKLPQALCLGEETVSEALRNPELVPIGYANEAVLGSNLVSLFVHSILGQTDLRPKILEVGLVRSVHMYSTYACFRQQGIDEH